VNIATTTDAPMPSPPQGKFDEDRRFEDQLDREHQSLDNAKEINKPSTMPDDVNKGGKQMNPATYEAPSKPEVAKEQNWNESSEQHWQNEVQTNRKEKSVSDVAPVIEEPKKPVEEPKKPEPLKTVKVDHPIRDHDKEFSRYPFDDLDIGQGFFVSDKDTKGDNLEFMRKNIYYARNHYSITEHDINGDEVWENVIVRGRQRTGKTEYDAYGNMVNEFHRDSNGQAVQTASEESRPRRIYSRHFSAKKVYKDEVIGDNDFKAPENGVLVIREA
jgi:hypothetical protein